MLPNPLHPAIVHFPVVLMLLLPLVALGALYAIRRGAATIRAWAFPVVVAAALSLSAWAAVETGEGEEERVEAVVPESVLDQHAESAQRFLLLSLGVLGLMGAGFLRGRGGSVARGVAAAAAVMLTVAGYKVGHTGGSLVYTHGAASAYGTNPAPAQGDRESRN
ncbi:MAG TPA: DUF2231 domain-containing protein [Gemmatimonadales bacterium]|nr:DUF2231 domain-containing protein [Gemmatimonadales bacterium]